MGGQANRQKGSACSYPWMGNDVPFLAVDSKRYAPMLLLDTARTKEDPSEHSHALSPDFCIPFLAHNMSHVSNGSYEIVSRWLPVVSCDYRNNVLSKSPTHLSFH